MSWAGEISHVSRGQRLQTAPLISDKVYLLRGHGFSPPASHLTFRPHQVGSSQNESCIFPIGAISLWSLEGQIQDCGSLSHCRQVAACFPEHLPREDSPWMSSVVVLAMKPWAPSDPLACLHPRSGLASSLFLNTETETHTSGYGIWNHC